MVFSHVIWGRPGGLFQFSGGGAIRIICIIIYMCSVPKCGKTPWLEYRCKVRLSSSPARCEQIGAIWFQAVFSGTTDQEHQSCMRPPSCLHINGDTCFGHCRSFHYHDCVQLEQIREFYINFQIFFKFVLHVSEAQLCGMQSMILICQFIYLSTY